jgi:hypothetical protein
VTRFYLGTHRGRWLEDHQFSGVPLFVTYNTLSAYQRHGDDFPKGVATDYSIDSGAYTEISRYGEWRDPPDIYGGRVYRFIDDIGRPPDFVAIQDWPVEPAARAASGLTVEDHLEFTLDSLLYLRAEFPLRHTSWLPILQGWRLDDYLRHEAMHRAVGIDLTQEPLVGLGSVCKRGSSVEIAAIVTALAAMGIRLHCFGVKRDGLARIGHAIASADSLAWSATARRSGIRLPGCVHRGPCNNCPRYARQWWQDTVDALDIPQQTALALNFAA